MSLYLYDEAITNKIKYWTQDTSLHVYGPDATKRFFEVELDEHDDKPIELPLIRISRNSGYNILNASKRPLSFDGMHMNATLLKTMQLNAIPISISYQIDVYTRHMRDADEIVRNLVFNIINHPKITICIPYEGQNINHDSNLRIKEEVVDNSAIPERLSLGQFTRFSVSVVVDDAYLWDTRIRNNLKLEWEVENDREKIIKGD